jgi:hypothetical protein
MSKLSEAIKKPAVKKGIFAAIKRAILAVLRRG